MIFKYEIKPLVAFVVLHMGVKTMIIGVPKEVKNQEKRVSMIPGGVLELVESGHKVFVETGAGVGSGYPDESYVQAGAQIVDATTAWSADIVVKVKEPQKSEFKYFRKDLIIFTYLHLTGVEKELTDALLESGATGIAYETVTNREGRLPLLMPMSAIAGKLSIQVASTYLSAPNGGRGVLIDGMPGVHSGKVVILGGGIVGASAARVALGRGAKVTIIDRDLTRLTYLEDTLRGKLTTLMSNYFSITAAIKNADVVVGAALVPGAKAPKLVTRDMIKKMKAGTVVVDVSIDQGGCFETSRPTTHDNPVYVEHGVIHYCVSNMPGAYPRTATIGLANATISYLSLLANKGLVDAVKSDLGLANGVNVYKGYLTHQAVADDLHVKNKYKALKELL